MTHLLLTVRFLDARYHGLLSRGGPPEWPPSPFRLFQALVAGVARRGELITGKDIFSHANLTEVGQALDWLQRQTRERPPVIIAPRSKEGQGIIRFAPNNDGDRQFDRQDRLTAKPTIPTLFLLESGEKPVVHYVWDIEDRQDCPETAICDAARALTSLGWGIDMAFADARRVSASEVQKLKGVRWYPKRNAGSLRDTVRTPTFDDERGECSLCNLRQCHSAFVNRIEDGKPLKTVERPRVFDRVLYTSVERPAARPHVVFRLIDENGETWRYPHAQLVHIAGMVRHAAIKVMSSNPPPVVNDPIGWTNRVVRGKRDESAGDAHRQFSYVPLASIGHEHADAMIRNVMVIAPLGMEGELAHMAEQLNGQALEPEGEFAASKSDSKPRVPERLELQRFTPPPGRFIETCYLGRSRVWQSVTPVILDGHVKRWKEEIDGDQAVVTDHAEWIRKALQRAGIETPCEFTWRPTPFMKNTLSAYNYDRNGRCIGYHRPAHLKNLTAIHVRLEFSHDVPGPLAIGAGRHCGFGVFAAVH